MAAAAEQAGGRAGEEDLAGNGLWNGARGRSLGNVCVTLQFLETVFGISFLRREKLTCVLCGGGRLRFTAKEKVGVQIYEMRMPKFHSPPSRSLPRSVAVARRRRIDFSIFYRA